MDSEHRHELKSNDLADFLTHLPEFYKKNSNIILGLTLIIIALITAPMFSKMARQKEMAEQSQVSDGISQLNQSIGNTFQNAEEDTSAALDAILVNAQNLSDEAAKLDGDAAAMAYIKAGQAYRIELHLKKEIIGADKVADQVQKAEIAYNNAAAKAKTPTLKAMAQLGLSLCAEERGQTEQAKTLYQAIVDDETFAATALPKQAQIRIDALEENSETFTFVKAPEEPVPPITDELQKAIESGQVTIEEKAKPVESTQPEAPAENN